MLPNYAKDNIDRMPFEYYMEEYRKASPVEISNRLGIPFDGESKEFTVSFLGTEYAVSWPECRCTGTGGGLRDTGETFGFLPLADNVHAKILVLRYLLYASVFPHNGDFRSYRELPSGELYYRQFQGRCIFRLNRKYGNRLETLDRIMESLGAVPVAGADRGYELELFENLYLRFLFWERDEEFPSSAQILFSSNFPAAFSTYDLAEIGEICIHTFGALEKQEEGK